MSCLLATSLAAQRPARAQACTTPSGCTAIGDVCHLGICTPCEANYTDGGIDPVLIACQDPSQPICDIPDGSLGGQCVQCVSDSQCAGAICELATNTCADAGIDGGVPSDGGADAETRDGASDGAPSDSGTSGSGDGSTSADGGETGDGSAGADASTNDDGGAGSDGSSAEDGASDDGATTADATAEGSTSDGSSGTAPDGSPGEGGVVDGAYVEGGGCSCDAVGGATSAGGASFALLAMMALAARRRRR